MTRSRSALKRKFGAQSTPIVIDDETSKEKYPLDAPFEFPSATQESPSMAPKRYLEFTVAPRKEVGPSSVAQTLPAPSSFAAFRFVKVRPENCSRELVPSSENYSNGLYDSFEMPEVTAPKVYDHGESFVSTHLEPIPQAPKTTPLYADEELEYPDFLDFQYESVYVDNTDLYDSMEAALNGFATANTSENDLFQQTEPTMQN